MSMLPPDVHSVLSQLLQGLQSADNVVRTNAEESLNNEWIATRPDVLLMALVEQMQGAQEIVTRSFAAVIFRRVASKTRKDPASDSTKDLFTTLQPPQRDAIRTKMLECLGSEKDNSVRHQIADAVSEIARQAVMEDESWPQLLGVLFNASQSTDPYQRETAFRIFAQCPDVIEKEHEDAVLSAFAKGLKDDSVIVRLAVIEAFSAFFGSINKGAQKKYFKLAGDILSILPVIKATGDSDDLSRAFMSLTELVESSTKMFKDHFNDLITFSVGIMQDKDFEDRARQNALELMTTFADNSPAMCRNQGNYTSQMVTQCLSLMTDVGVDDDNAEDWNASEDLDSQDNDENHFAAEQCMDRLANKLGGQLLLPPTFTWLPQMMSSTAWRDRHAALMAISAISEGCRDLMIGELDKVLDLVLPALQDPHPRVRWAGCNALGQMSTDFATTIEEKYHHIVLPAIVPVLESTEPRVQSHAAAALVNFCEEADPETLEPYLDNLISQLMSLLQSPKTFVQEQALSTIATVADSAEAAFSRYYDTLMPLLLNVLRDTSSEDLKLLRAKAMECASLIAKAVGREKMGQDAITLVHLLGNIQQNLSGPDDPQAGYLLHCWGRMCGVLRNEFLPYLPAVMPPVVKMASAKADIQLLENDEQAAAVVDDEENWELVPLKGRQIAIKTSTLEDKNTAIELIMVYAQNLEGAFDPYVTDVMDNIVLPGLAFFFHDPVRVTSAKTIPQLLNSVKKAHGDGSPQLTEIWGKTLPKIMEALGSEPSVDTLSELYQCFYEAIEVMGKDSLSTDQMKAFIDITDSVLKDYKQRVQNRHDQAGDPEEEEDEEDLLMAIEDDQTLLSDMNKAFHTIMKHHTLDFLPQWDRLLNYYDEFIQTADATQRQWALCLFDDVLEFCGPQSWGYSSHIINPLVRGIQDDTPANRQAAAYGAGVAAQKGGDQWSEFAAGTLPLLFQATKHSQAREDDHVFATENACAAIAKILRFNASKVSNIQEVVNHWIETLPVTNDDEAAPYAYSFLAELIDQQHPAITSHAVKAFTAIAEALAAETLQGQTANRVVAAAKTLVQNTGMDGDAALASLSPESQQTVRAYFSGPPPE